MNETPSAGDRLFEIPGGWRHCELDIRGAHLRLTVPADPNRVLDAQIRDLQASGDREQAELPDPYWATLWSAATPMAEAVLGASWPPHATVLELGCGVGLVGLAALLRGWQVTFSDYTPQAIGVALENARQNGYAQVEALVIDWHEPPPRNYDVIVASDVLYNGESHRPLIGAIDRLLAPGGVCWIGDPGRNVVRDFLHMATDRFHVQLLDRDGHAFAVPNVGQFQLLVLHRR